MPKSAHKIIHGPPIFFIFPGKLISAPKKNIKKIHGSPPLIHFLVYLNQHQTKIHDHPLFI